MAGLAAGEATLFRLAAGLSEEPESMLKGGWGSSILVSVFKENSTSDIKKKKKLFHI